jgi:hypothetical protein
MTGTTEGGKKAAETRKENDPQAFEKMGEKGGQSKSSSQSASSKESGSHSEKDSSAHSSQKAPSRDKE